jgi:hypothetical protein
LTRSVSISRAASTIEASASMVIAGLVIRSAAVSPAI